MSQTIADLLAALERGDETRAEAAAAGLAALPLSLQREARAALEELLASPEAEARWWAVRGLAALPGEEVIPLLLQALEDGDAAVRQCAVLGLRQQPDGGAVTGLTRALDDSDTLARRMAGEALQAIGSEAVPALLELMGSGSQAARLEAARALAGIGDTRAIPALFEALDDSALMAYWAGEGLERMGVGMRFFKPG